MTEEITDAEVVSETAEEEASASGQSISTAMTPAPLPAPSFGVGPLSSAGPAQAIALAAQVASSLADIIQRQELFVDIRGRRHVKVEGWQTLASLLGFVPTEISVVRLEGGGFESTVELRNLDGISLSRASAECGTHNDFVGYDKNGEAMYWSDRAEYAQRSMATTRAISRSCANAFRWVMSLAGYATTPYEEMSSVDAPPSRPPQRAPSQPPRQQPSAPAPPGARGGVMMPDWRELKKIACPRCNRVGYLRESKAEYVAKGNDKYYCWNKPEKEYEGCGAYISEIEMYRYIAEGAIKTQSDISVPTSKDIAPEHPSAFDPER